MRSRIKNMFARRGMALAITAVVFLIIFRRIPLPRLLVALEQADYSRFFAAMIPNTIFYFCWDTLVLTLVVRWFHGPVRYRDLLPVRAASYAVAFFNTNAGRGALAAYLSYRFGSPFLQLGSTVLFLVLTEYLHLVLWATLGILMGPQSPRELLWVPPAVALLWLVVFGYMRAGAVAGASPPPPAPTAARTPSVVRWLLAPREWALLRTFRLAPARDYITVVLVRSPMFAVSLCLHYIAARAFGLEIPFASMLAFLPVIFMAAALPITVAHLGTTQAAWIFFFGSYAPEAQLLAFSLAAHLTFVITRSLLGVLFLPRAYTDLVHTARLAVGERQAVRAQAP